MFRIPGTFDFSFLFFLSLQPWQVEALMLTNRCDIFDYEISFT